jgi:hypothetical protein
MPSTHDIQKKNSKIQKGKKNRILLETKDDQVLYSYKNVRARNEFHEIMGKKDKIEHAHIHVLFTIYLS